MRRGEEMADTYICQVVSQVGLSSQTHCHWFLLWRGKSRVAVGATDKSREDMDKGNATDKSREERDKGSGLGVRRSQK